MILKKLGVVFFFLCPLAVPAQDRCVQAAYLQQQMVADPGIAERLQAMEMFYRSQSNTPSSVQRTQSVTQVIRIPVVFHVLYHQPGENISMQRIQEQINTLNRDFRRKNADSTQTPASFTPLAADMEIEFHLAVSDPMGRSTTGVVRKYTPVTFWQDNDDMKFSSKMGSDAWDTRSYLNIWVCNLRDALGYSGFPGVDAVLDGVVLNYEVVGNSGSYSQYNMGRTAVHEVGHWLNLKHIWGDDYCGDDGVEDTPKQSTYTPGCPTGIRRSCGNSTAGDMYMNYLDFTADACVNMFTQGQKQRARALFEPGGPRHSILTSKGFDDPLIYESPLPDFYPKWLYAQVYPNPARDMLHIYFDYDPRWMGKYLQITDVTGRILIKERISSGNMEINISRLQPGIYFIRAEQEHEKMLQKFIKL